MTWTAFIPGVILAGALFWVSSLIARGAPQKPSQRIPEEVALGEPETPGGAERDLHGLPSPIVDTHGAL